MIQVPFLSFKKNFEKKNVKKVRTKNQPSAKLQLSAKKNEITFDIRNEKIAHFRYILDISGSVPNLSGVKKYIFLQPVKLKQTLPNIFNIDLSFIFLGFESPFMTFACLLFV